MTRNNTSSAITYDLLRKLSAQDFQNFGAPHVAYIRAANVQGKTLYFLHGADGQQLSAMNSLNDALAIAHHNDLEPVAVH